jgi:hypothetical protein
MRGLLKKVADSESLKEHFYSGSLIVPLRKTSRQMPEKSGIFLKPLSK